MKVQELITAKQEVESNLFRSISPIVKGFRRSTGYPIMEIWVKFQEVGTQVGSDYIVESVSVDLDIDL